MMISSEFDAVPISNMAYRQLIMTLDHSIGTEECQKLVFLVIDLGIPRAKLERTNEALDIFEELEKRMLVTHDDISLLIELIELIHRLDLLRLIEAYCQSNGIVWGRAAGTSQISSYRKLLLEVSDDTSSNETKQFKSFCRGKLGRQALIDCKYPFQLFILLEQRRILSPNNLGFLLELLEFTGNKQLVDKVNKVIMFTYSPKMPSDIEIEDLSRQLANEWTSLASYLGVPYNMVDNIKHDHQSTQERIKAMLFGWRHGLSSGENAYDILATGLKSCGRMDLAEKVRGYAVNAKAAYQRPPPIKSSHLIQEHQISYSNMPYRKLMRPSDFQSTPAPPVLSCPLKKNHGPNVTDKTLMELSGQLAGSWKALGTYLELDHGAISTIDGDRNSTANKAFEMLIMWRNKLTTASDATKILAIALEDVRRMDLAGYVREIKVDQPKLDPEVISKAIQPMSSAPQAGNVQSPEGENLTVKSDAHPMEQSEGENLTVKSDAHPMEQSEGENLTVKSEAHPMDQSVHETNLVQHVQEEVKYKMDRIPRGLCIIINNEKFDKGLSLSDREGTNVDSGKLDNLFNKLHFQVCVKTNMQATEMSHFFSDLSRVDHSSFDCFVCCILSHGQLGRVFGTDGESVEIQDILQHFKAVSCPSLAGKPKLFFIQACQGESIQKGVNIEEDGPGMGNGLQRTLPVEADFLLSYATVPGYVSYRHKLSGSWYVEALVNEMEKHNNELDLVRILTRVNSSLSKAATKKLYKQMPAPCFTLRKEVYLRSFKSDT